MYLFVDCLDSIINTLQHTIVFFRKKCSKRNGVYDFTLWMNKEDKKTNKKKDYGVARRIVLAIANVTL